MPRARSPNRDKAFTLWIESKGQRELKDIAAELGVSPEQVRKWKHADDWDGRTQKVTLPNGKGHVTKRKRGGQKGNKNAVGNKGGAPKGNTNGLKHGAYSRVMAELLTGDEAEVFADDGVGTEIEFELRETLATLNVKEIRLMKRINAIMQEAKGGQIISNVDSITTERQVGKFERDEKGRVVGKGDGKKFVGEIQKTTSKHTVSAYEALGALEAELDRVQARKIKVLTKLEDIRVQRERLALEKKRVEGETDQGKLARAWIEAITGESLEDDDENGEVD